MSGQIGKQQRRNAGQVAVDESRAPRLRVLQPDMADSFRKAKAALEDAAKDIAALRRRAGDFTRRSG